MKRAAASLVLPGCATMVMQTRKCCLIAEPTSSDNIEIGQKGGLIIVLKANGKSAHGSLGGFKGENAILKLLRFWNKLPQLTTIEGHYKEKPDACIAEFHHAG